MTSKMQRGYLVLADISGYTSFMAGVELEHADQILSELLELIVDRFKPVLTIAKLEGDAVFAFASEERITRGETVLEIIESTYVAFRDKVDAIRRRTTCDCNACKAIPSLDLKFVVHVGEYVSQSVAGGLEVIGSDVNLAHRLMKNQVAEATGWRAYLLFTAAALEALGIEPRPADKDETSEWESLVESYEHLGDVKVSALNLIPRYRAFADARRVLITPEEADLAFQHDFVQPPPVVWEWLNDPLRRSQWQAGNEWSAATRLAGRTAVGARNHCSHGKGVVVETILDWRPFDYFTTQSISPGRFPPPLLETHLLEETPTGTKLSSRIQAKMGAPRWFRRFLCRLMFFRLFDLPGKLDDMARLMAEEQARLSAAA